MEDTFEPVVLGFLCNWCAYAGADLAGVSRLQYPPNLRVIRVNCSGMVHPELVVSALSRGVDGVMVMGWHLGDCHYLEGNHKAKSRTEATQLVLETLNIDPERYALEWVSSAEAPRFARVVTEFVEKIRALGPNPLRPEKTESAEAAG